MPLYEYHCDACGRRFELIRKFSDPPLEACPSCGGAVRKLFSSPAIQFKGSGFYITDYPKKDQPGPGKNDKNDKNDKSDSADKADKNAQTDKTGKSESKTESSKTESAKTDTAKSDRGTASETKPDKKTTKPGDSAASSSATTPTKPSSSKD